MPPSTTSVSTNHLRRALGFLVCSLPLVVPLASIARAHERHWSDPYTFVAPALLALLLALLNAWLSFVRPVIVALRRQPQRHVSGVPVIGSTLVLIACLPGFGAAGTAAICLAAAVLDTGGLPWFLLWTWKDRSIWDEDGHPWW